MPLGPSRRTSRSTSSSRSDHSTGGSLRDNELSLNLFAEGNGHWGTMVYRTEEKRGQLYHVRSDPLKDPDRFSFDSREQGIESPSAYGRSILGRYSDGERRRVEAALLDYGNTEEHIPRRSTNTNCQTFTTGAYARLEDDGLLAPGNADYFRRFHGHKGKDIRRALLEDGRSWIPAEKFRSSGPIDARFGDPVEERRPAGRLNIAGFEDTFGRPRGRDDAPRMLEVRPSSRAHSRSRSRSRNLDPLSDPDYFNRSAGGSSSTPSIRYSSSRSATREFDDLPGPDFFTRG
ncbi:MAG: hypothetical protein M1821_003523 [Bathelium mastoideum]|nr:MAG: hypothetical protein M1821_003523 [Bathelium mastoideum]